MCAATLTLDHAVLIARTRPGREAAAANKRALTGSRMDEATFLLSCGVSTEEAEIRAGWPSVGAAARASRRAGNIPLARTFDRLHMTQRHKTRSKEITR